MKIDIDVIGIGYVGYAMSLLLSESNSITLYDIDKGKVESINKGEALSNDELCIDYANKNKANLNAKLFDNNYSTTSEIVVICVPTDFDEKKLCFNTEILENVISRIRKSNKDCLIVIKSTISIGFTEKMQEKYDEDIIFSPEFLREQNSLKDNIFPSRIVVGSSTEKAKKFGNLLRNLAKNNPEVLYVDSKEAELIKLASNSYLATRVSFFNEIDNFALKNGLNSNNIINAISLDPRIGNQYNNPSFGYGGYCLPKDSKQLSASFGDVPHPLIKSIQESNFYRKKQIALEILSFKPDVIGVYRLVMKSGSDNFRESAILDVINILKESKTKIIIYEPNISDSKFIDIEVVPDINDFVSESDVIIANRLDEETDKFKDKIFSRDLYRKN